MAKFCTQCGSEIGENMLFCTQCGAKAPANEAPKAVPRSEPIYEPEYELEPTTQPRASGRISASKLVGTKYEPISMGGYIGIMLLSCIPIVGIVVLVIWACGGCTKINKRNFARAMLVMMAISLVLSLIVGLIVGALAKKAVDEIGENFDELMGGIVSATADSPYADLDEDGGDVTKIISGFEAMAGLEAMAQASGSEGSTDLSRLGELTENLEALEGILGEDELDSILGLIDNVEEINAEAEAKNDGWPKNLRPYPGGNAQSETSYRTKITDTTKEEMHEYIDSLKQDGFAYKDFYDFGMSEEDMLSIDGWWGTDGELYLSISYLDGVVTIDHTKELPDLSSYFE